MGIANPRPAMRKAEARKITNQLAAHAKLMQMYIELGMSKTQASKEALQDIKTLAKRRKS